MIERILQAQISIRWGVADTVYGSNQDVRDDLEFHRTYYVLAVRCTEPAEIQTANGRQRMTVAEAEARLLGEQDWQRLSMGQGTKGPPWFDWVSLPMLHRCEEDGQHWLFIRRSLTNPTDKRYYFVFGPKETTLTQMVEAIGARWKIEEDFETSKGLGLDQYKVRTWTAWYRHITLVLFALAFLASICVHDQATKTTEQDSTQQEEVLLPLTRPEVSHLLGQLIWPSPHNVALLLAWSWWRHCHRGRASYYRRLQAG